MDRKEFGKLIAILRQELGWTQFDLAEYSEIDEGTISNIERGAKKNLEPELLFRLANALQLTTLERREFFLAASGIEQEKIVRQPGFDTPTKVFDAQAVLQELTGLIARFYLPAHLGDVYGDILAVNPALLDLLQLTPEAAQSAAQSGAGFNNLHFLYGNMALQKTFGDALSPTILHSLRAFRESSLRYRTKPRYQRLLKEFRDVKKYPLFERYWRKVITMDHDKETMLDTISTQHPQYGTLTFTSTSAVTITPYGELFLSQYTPLNRETALAFINIMERVGQGVIHLSPWPEKGPAA
jgi:transcriptional regulator with XRE-family HTH domain